jgi:shikimate dehydrogenase
MPRLAVIGHPVAHSRSPAMQNAALTALGLGEEWSYEAIDVAPERFEERVRAMAAEGFAGANVTVPHKKAALALADAAGTAATAIGAANTLSFSAAGIEADNTDAGGLRESLPGSPRGRRALVLGAGGAARAAIWMLAREGAAVDVWNRTGSRADEISVALGGAPVTDFRQSSYGIIVNATAVGLRGEDPFEHLPLTEASLGEYLPESLQAEEFTEQVVVDMVYGERPSRLLAAAKENGATTVDGIEVLVQQGALSLQIWTDREAPIEVMSTAARA